jgi:ligand-binding sensor domain-containing protein
MHSNVNSIVQDARGYIWILTLNGLQRYDGTRFVNYPFDLDNPDRTSLIRDMNLFADKENNNLWLISGEIEKLNLKTNKFTLYAAEKVLQNSEFKFESYKDAAGRTWLAGPMGLFFYSSNEKKILPYYMAATSLSSQSYNFFTDVTSGDIWLADWHGLSLFDKKTKSVYTHEYNPTGNALLQLMDKKKLTGIFKDSEQNIWIGSGSNTFYKYNSILHKLSVYSLAQIEGTSTIKSPEDHIMIVKCFFEDDHHNIWIGTANGGLLQYQRDSDSFTFNISNEKDKQALHYNYEILCIFQDQESNIWIGTDNGINIFNPYQQQLQTIQHEDNNPASIPKNEIQHCIQAANGDIICGTWGGGITVYDSSWNFKRNLLFEGPYEYNLVWSFVQNDDGNIWIGCQHGYIHLYNPVKGLIKTIHPPELEGYTIWNMTKDKAGNIWIGLHDGKIAKWDKQEQKFYPYNNHVKSIEQPYAPVLNIFFDNNQFCWVGTENGFKKFDTKQRLYTEVYIPDKTAAQSISASSCRGIEQYDDSTLLIGTGYGGFNFFNTATKKFTHYTVKDGLPANNIHAIKKDAEGYIWFTTDFDLYKFKPGTKKFIRYNIEPGVISGEFKTTAFYALQNGSWITATAAEIICFRPQNKISNKQLAKVRVTGFKVFDESFAIDSLLDAGKPVTLSYQQNFLSVEFALLDFSNLQQTNYYYRLEGVDKDWVYTGTKRFASYTNLSPGKYTFSVKADNGNEITASNSFTIIITPPFWKTWWFILVIAVSTASLIYLVVQRRVKSIKDAQQTKIEMLGINEKLTAAKLEALRSQMNPHFIFNCLNSIDNLIQNNEKEKATLYLSKFAKLIRSVLENSKNNTIPCWKDMDTLKLYIELEEFRWDKIFSYQINIAPEILQGDYKVPPLVIQPFVENAIHHGLLNKIEADKKLVIDVFAGDNYIYYSICDNGVGRAKAAGYKELNKSSHESMGMQITIDRINLFNQINNGSVKITDLVNEHNEPTGTKVEVALTNQS